MDGSPYFYSVVALSGEQNHRCAYCKQTMELRFDGDRSLGRHATRDHVIPRSLGGSDEWENLVAACSFCNQLRGTTNALWFMSFMEHLFAWTELPNRWHQLRSEEQSRLRRLVRRRYKRHLMMQEQRFAVRAAE